MKKKQKKWDTLEGVLMQVWQMLKRGVTHFNDPFHWPVLGTTGRDGVSLRTVILRQVPNPQDNGLKSHSQLDSSLLVVPEDDQVQPGED